MGEQFEFAVKRGAKTIVIDLDTMALSVEREAKGSHAPRLRLEAEQVSTRVRLTLTNTDKRSVRLLLGFGGQRNDQPARTETSGREATRAGQVHSFVTEKVFLGIAARLQAVYDPGNCLDLESDRPLVESICASCWTGAVVSRQMTPRSRDR